MTTKFVLVRQSAIQSVISDAFTFGCLAGLWVFNYRVIGGDGWLSALAFFMSMVFLLGRATKLQNVKRVDSLDEAARIIEEWRANE